MKHGFLAGIVAFGLWWPLVMPLCGSYTGDPRRADVVVPVEDTIIVGEAINYWNSMGAGLDWKIVDRCSHDHDRQCVTISGGSSTPFIDEVGRCVPTRDGSDIVIVPGGTRSAHMETLRHEIGHALGLNHTRSSPADVMDAKEGFTACITRETQNAWKHMYGVTLELGCLAP